MEIAQLEEEDATSFLDDLGISEPALNRMIIASYRLLNLISFFTVGDDEVRAWTVTRGVTAPEAAGVIHSDLERGFIRAETLDWKSLLELGGWQAAKEKGNAAFKVKRRLSHYYPRDIQDTSQIKLWLCISRIIF